MLTQCGPICDVCGKYILSGDLNPFGMTGIKGTLMCHDLCKNDILSAGESWQKLPSGPLRKAFEDQISGKASIISPTSSTK
jgi:hypothetical protein